MEEGVGRFGVVSRAAVQFLWQRPVGMGRMGIIRKNHALVLPPSIVAQSFAASALNDLQLPREFAEAQPAMADSPAMPVLLHQLPDGDTTGQQWAELPPVLGATQMPRWSARARSRGVV